MAEQDVIDRLLSLSPEQQRATLGKLSPDQLNVVRQHIQQRKAGAQTQTPPETPETIAARHARGTGKYTPPNPVLQALDPVGRFAESAVDTAAGILPSMVHTVMDPPRNPVEQFLGTGPLLTAYRSFQPQIDELKKAANPKRSSVNRAGHAVAGAVPIAGPLGADVAAAGLHRGIPEALGKATTYAALPLAIGGVGELGEEAGAAIRSSDTPRALLQRAEDIRSRPATKLPGTGIGLKSSVVHRAAQEVAKRRPIARTYEAVGETLAGKNRGPLTRGEVAADEASRIRQAQNINADLNKTPALPQEKLNIPYPKPPSFIDIPITDPASAMKSIEEKIGPSGRIAKKTSQVVNEKGQPTPFGRTLLQEVPELATAPKGPQADAALYSGYQRVLQRVNEAEDAIPEGTTVDNIPIVSGFEALKQEYIDRGLVKSADAIDKLSKQWVGLMDLPWGEFLSRKRAFFAEHNLSSSPMRRAYGVLMEASERAAPQLSEANQAYSTVRRALDNAQIDPNTGRRISQVGKAPKTPVHQMQESRPLGKTEVKSEPVKNRAEALERLEQPERRTQNVPVKTERRQMPSITNQMARNHLLIDDSPEIVPPGAATLPKAGMDLAFLPQLNVEALGKGIGGESANLASSISARMNTIRETIEGGNTDVTGKAIGHESERGSPNYGTEQKRTAGGGIMTLFPELEALGRSPGVIAKAIKQGKGPLYTQIREVVKDAMRDELQSRAKSGTEPYELRQRALGVMRQRLPQP